MISIIIGTRPEIIKMAPLITLFEKIKLDYEIIFTGQHYDKNLTNIFFDELMLPHPHVHFDIGSGTQPEQIGAALKALDKQFRERRPDLLLVEGDTNTVLSGALIGEQLDIPVGHVEAGLRSYDFRMPEEHNRRLTDHLSTLLFAPTEHTRKILETENVSGAVHITGNTIIDACMHYLPVAEERSQILTRIEPEDFVLATAHRAENVDDPSVLKNLVEIFDKCPLPVVFPIHPRTVKTLKLHGLYEKLSFSDNIQLIEPVGYFDFLMLIKTSRFVISDSGGIQEEVTAPNLNKKVFVTRLSTDRPEAVESGYAELVGVDSEHVLNCINNESSWTIDAERAVSPFGTGDTAEQIHRIIENQ
jgi:UDP-N-acetylglucosamine 2-epimerase (non-hydrolysing)